MGYMDKLVLYFDSVFWPNDADWLFYIGDGINGEWLLTLNINKYLDVPILMMFNVADDAIHYSSYSD